MSDNLLGQLRDDAKIAYKQLHELFVSILSDAQFRPRLTDQQKRQEFQQFMGLPPEQQARIMGQMQTQEIDTEKWLSDRQKLMEV